MILITLKFANELEVHKEFLKSALFVAKSFYLVDNAGGVSSLKIDKNIPD